MRSQSLLIRVSPYVVETLTARIDHVNICVSRVIKLSIVMIINPSDPTSPMASLAPESESSAKTGLRVQLSYKLH